MNELKSELGRASLAIVVAGTNVRRVHLLLPQLEIVLVLAALLAAIKRMGDRFEIGRRVCLHILKHCVYLSSSRALRWLLCRALW